MYSSAVEPLPSWRSPGFILQHCTHHGYSIQNFWHTITFQDKGSQSIFSNTYSFNLELVAWFPNYNGGKFKEDNEKIRTFLSSKNVRHGEIQYQVWKELIGDEMCHRGWPISPVSVQNEVRGLGPADVQSCRTYSGMSLYVTAWAWSSEREYRIQLPLICPQGAEALVRNINDHISGDQEMSSLALPGTGCIPQTLMQGQDWGSDQLMEESVEFRLSSACMEQRNRKPPAVLRAP